MHLATVQHGLLLRMLMRSLGETVRLLAVRMSCGRMHLRLFVLTLIVMMGRFPMVMGSRFVIGRGSVMMCTRRVFCHRSHKTILL
jgi:hypothetical protein